MKKIFALIVLILLSASFGAKAAETLCVAKIENGVVARVESVNPNALPDQSESALVAFLRSLYGDDTQWRQCFADGSRRKQYPGPGYTYDQVSDKFIAPQPFPSWSLNDDKDWVAPVPMPTDGKRYGWDEDLKSWTEIK